MKKNCDLFIICSCQKSMDRVASQSDFYSCGFSTTDLKNALIL